MGEPHSLGANLGRTERSPTPLEFFEEKEHRRARSRLLTQSRGALTALRWPLSGTTKRAAIEDRIA